jgi:hypothetical protein
MPGAEKQERDGMEDGRTNGHEGGGVRRNIASKTRTQRAIGLVADILIFIPPYLDNSTRPYSDVFSLPDCESCLAMLLLLIFFTLTAYG